MRTLQKVECPTCRAKPGQKCFEYSRGLKNYYQLEWSETVHFARQKTLIQLVSDRLDGSKPKPAPTFQDITNLTNQCLLSSNIMMTSPRIKTLLEGL